MPLQRLLCACLGSGAGGESQAATKQKNKPKKLSQAGLSPSDLQPASAAQLAAAGKALAQALPAFDLQPNTTEEDGYIPAVLSHATNRSSSTFSNSAVGNSSSIYPPQPELEAAISIPFSAHSARILQPVHGEAQHQLQRIPLRDSWDGLVMIHSPDANARTEDGATRRDSQQPELQASEIGGSATGSAYDAAGASFSDAITPEKQLSEQYYLSQRSAALSGAQEVNAFEIASPAAEQAEGEPFPSPQILLQNIGMLIAANDKKSVLTALRHLRGGLKPHKQHFKECLGELLAVVTACLDSQNDVVVSAALSAGTELVKVFGDYLLQPMHAQTPPQTFLMRLLICATSPTRPRSIQAPADSLLRRISSTMHQVTILRMLEPLAVGHTAVLDVKSKAAAMVLIATYRL